MGQVPWDEIAFIIELLQELGIPEMVTEMLSEILVAVLPVLLVFLGKLLVDLGISVVSFTGALVGTVIAGLVGIVVAVVTAIVTLVIELVLYVLLSVGWMRIAKKLGVKHRFLAWIPFARQFLVGDCAEKSIERNGKKPWKWSVILLVAKLLVFFGGWIFDTVIGVACWVLPIPGLATFLGLIPECLLLGISAYCMFRIFKELSGTTGSVIMTLFVVLWHDLEAIVVFIASFFKLRKPMPAPAPTQPRPTENVEQPNENS